jgi:hypothetical protein
VRVGELFGTPSPVSTRSTRSELAQQLERLVRIFGEPKGWDQMAGEYLIALGDLSAGEIEAGVSWLIANRDGFMPTPAAIRIAAMNNRPEPRMVPRAVSREPEELPEAERVTPEQAAEVLRKYGFTPDADIAGTPRQIEGEPWIMSDAARDELFTWQRIPMPPEVLAADRETKCKALMKQGVSCADAIRRLELRE